ncbi:MAG: UDP-2,3-diacylglucosamine diphosphatase LpxI [Bryobacteraceae bacterium]
MPTPTSQERLGMIAGNGRFPILALQAARLLRLNIVVLAIEEEASREVEALASSCHWISLGSLSRLIEICKQEGVSRVMMCGQVKHAKIFSSIRPDWRLFKVLASLGSKNTDSLIGAVIRVLADEGVEIVDSTMLLKDLLAGQGALTKRKLSSDERTDIEYGRRVAGALAGFDVGQSVAIADRACVAVEAMEGTDEMLRRAAGLCEGKPLRLVKVSRRRKHLLFDVPVAGTGTIDTMAATGTTALAVDADRTLFLDREEMLRKADQAGIAIEGFAPAE